MSHFAFLQSEWPDLHAEAVKAETRTMADPRTACFHARRTLELAVKWLYTHDQSLKLPYEESLSALTHEPSFRDCVGATIFAKVQLIRRLGNQAVHTTRPIRQYDAVMVVQELFHFCFWLARTYAQRAKPAETLAFNLAALPKATEAPPQSVQQLQDLAARLAEKDRKLSELLADRDTLDSELVRLRGEVAAAKAANARHVDSHDYSEAQTRDAFIDLLLREAGWVMQQPGHDTEYPVQGMPNEKGEGFVDYVLWGDDGKPLAVVEAKRTKRDPRVGQQQAKLYADCLEKQFGRRPVIFYSNGYEHWLWDDASYAPREVQGFYKKAELELMIQRRQSRKRLAGATINEAIVERYYQTRAIRRIGEAFERDAERKALVVMATGAGKTRTVIALCDQLMRSNWVKRVLFLADRVALVRQATNAFKRHLPDSSPVNLVTEKATEGRVFLSTYPTMMGLIDETTDGLRRFGVGHFDLIVIDEAHRSVFQKYRAIFDYFDALLVGLTATPKDEVDRNTYSLFDLQDGVPTDAYPLEDAVKDKFLVPARAVSVPLYFQREGIAYSELSDEEKAQWDELDWDEDGPPDRVDSEAVNKWLFNQDTVDKVLEHLMTHGAKVAGGDRIGKTIIFAKNQAHADYIAERFDANYPHYKGAFARTITFKTEYAQSLIDDFSQKDKAPHIAISVDMLDTGIDVPEVVNLVFFKRVRSKAKFWQMIGRGTRLCPGLFGPDQHKQFFYLFDYCQNLEFFGQNPEFTDGSVGASLGKRIFLSRLELIGEFDRADGKPVKGANEDGPARGELRAGWVTCLREEIGAMPADNFVVRPKRRFVEKYREEGPWAQLGVMDVQELAAHVAGLPSQLAADGEEAKRFDLLMLTLQLALIRAEPRFARLRDQVRAIAGLLEEQSAIPRVQQRLVLIEELQTDAWWEHVNLRLLETVRRELRDLVQLIEKTRRKPVFTDFEDEMGAAVPRELPGFSGAGDFERFRQKALAFLKAHQDHLAVQKLRLNEPLTATDLGELERMLVEAGVGGPEDLARAKQESAGLGLFVRSLVGMDREAAKNAFAAFMAGRVLTAAQIDFLNLIIEHLTERGAVAPAQLYSSPFTDVAPLGPEEIFRPAEVDDLMAIIEGVRSRAEA